jgi:hypothetical protein
VLDAPDDGLGDVEDLAALHAVDRGIGEVIPAGPTSGRQVIDDLVGVGTPRQVGSRCTGLLSPIAFHVVFALRLRFGTAFRMGLCRFGLVLRPVRVNLFETLSSSIH